jgi:hypothetical protein
MKRTFRLAVVAFAVFLCAGLFAAGSGSASTMTIDVQAFIDGRDQLVIQGSTLNWYHYDHQAPGKWNGNNYPVTINASLDGGPVTTAQWYEPQASSSTVPGVLTDLSPAVPATENVTLTVVKVRDSLSIVQAPNAGNGYTTIIEFNDNQSPGATWYEAKLTYNTP